MTLDPQIAPIVAALNAPDVPEYCDMSVAEARAAHEATAGRLGAPFVDIESVRDTQAPGPAGPIPVRIYDPAPSDMPKPCLLFYHGGGHVIGTLDSYDTLCRQLAAQSGCLVVSVDYRLAPEHRFPAAVEDTVAAYRWLLDEAEVLGADSGKIAIGGDSAGGNLAAVLAIQAREQGLAKPAMQILVYPATGSYPSSGSQLEFAENHVLTRRLILWFHAQYLALEDYTDTRWAPLLEPDHSGLPDLVMVLAGCDPLRDEGLAYASRLAQCGVGVTLKVYPGAVHPFFSWSGGIDIARDAVIFVAHALANLRDGDAAPPA